MKRYIKAIIAILAFFVAAEPVKAQNADQKATVKISGEVVTPFELSITDLARYPQTEVVRKDHDGKQYRYTGVVLSALLQKAGVTLGKDLRGKNLTKYVLVEAADGYKVVFALAELDKDFTDRMIILADRIDGKPFAASEGPFRIIVQDDKKPARCVRQVTAIKVLSAL